MKNYTSLHVKLINQVFELEKKTNPNPELSSLLRNIQRIKQYFEDEGYSILDPIGETYHETRTDYEATISGESSKNMQISNVIKPIVYFQENGSKTLLQKGVVIVNGQ